MINILLASQQLFFFADNNVSCHYAVPDINKLGGMMNIPPSVSPPVIPPLPGTMATLPKPSYYSSTPVGFMNTQFNSLRAGEWFVTVA